VPKTDHQRVAIFYDWLNQWGGAERVLLASLQAFPKADLYTIAHNPSQTPWLPKHYRIFSSIIDSLPKLPLFPLPYSPLFPLAVEQFDFSEYDIVISFTSTVGHFLITPPSVKYFCYFFNINRHVYRQHPFYLQPLAKFYRRLDTIAINRPDHLICDSYTVQNRFIDQYAKRPTVIYPGIDMSLFHPLQKTSPGGYFLIVSRLVPYKKIDLAIHACHQSGLQLKIVGNGRQFGYLSRLIKKLHSPNIELLGNVDHSELLGFYQHCRALLIPQVEDFGLTSLEAQACGRPVIAYRQGGQTETVIDGRTGLFFERQTVESLKSALRRFDSYRFNPKDCIENANKFSEKAFVLNLTKFVQGHL